MDSKELKKEICMPYIELCKYLQEKYGLPNGSYYCTESCKSKNRKISRTSEGLFCHHLYEHVYGSLNDPHIAKQCPYEYQKKENLVYCNFLEHWILHLKINIFHTNPTFNKALDVRNFFNSMGFFWIGNAINDIYKNSGSTLNWVNNGYLAIRDNYADYISLIRGMFCWLEQNYVGEKKIEIVKGAILPIDVISIDAGASVNGNYKKVCLSQKVVEISQDKNVVVKVENCTEKPYIRYANVVTLSKNSKDILISNNLDVLEQIYDLSSTLTELRSEVCRTSDGGMFDELLHQIEKPYDENDLAVANCLC